MVRSHHVIHATIAVVTATVCTMAPSATAEELQWLWRNVTHNLHEREVRAVAVDPRDPLRILVGTTRAIYRSSDGGRRWEERLTLRGEHTAIHALVLSPQQPARFYAATAHGVFRSTDGGASWKHLHREPSFAVLVDAVPSERLWSGTAEGLWLSEDAGRHWRRVTGLPSHRTVFALARDPYYPEQLYAATDAGLYRSDDVGQHWQSVFLVRTTSGEEDDPTAESEEASSPDRITALAFHPTKPGHVVCTTLHSAFESQDGGRSWRALPESGLATEALHHVLLTHASPTHLYVASNRGVFHYDDTAQRWEPLTRGLTAQQIYHLTIQPQDGSLWAATDRGVFHGVIVPQGAEGAQQPLQLFALFQHEPTIAEVQAMAVRYAETDPEKIARWRRAAATQALLPTVSVGFDHNKTISDQYDEGTFPKFQLVPTRDLDRNWDVSVSWDLGELIWNDDQLSIDSRSKLTTELREELLDEVTRFYFERRRLQVEVALEPLEDPKLAFEKELRIQELTAQLDALTGRGFSRALEGAL